MAERNRILSREEIRAASKTLDYFSITLRRRYIQVRIRQKDLHFEKVTHPATSEGLQACLALCKAMESDLMWNRFDTTLVKYGLGQKPVPQDSAGSLKTLKDIWDVYKRAKKDTPMSTRKAQWRLVEKWLKECPPAYLEIGNADKLLAWVRQDYTDGSIKNPFVTLKAAFNLCVKLGKVDKANPFPALLGLLKLPPKKVVKAFSLEELRIIIDAFKTARFDHPFSTSPSSYYAGLVEFRFLTGCRPSEAIALTWNDIIWDGDKCRIVFDKRWSEGEMLQGTKSGVGSRTFPCNEQLKTLLKSLPRNDKKLVFPAPRGGYIDCRNFWRNNWKPIVKKLVDAGEVSEYLSFYDQRHTFGTHVLRSGADVKSIAAVMGNSPETLMKHYIAANADIEIPEM